MTRLILLTALVGCGSSSPSATTQSNTMADIASDSPPPASSETDKGPATPNAPVGVYRDKHTVKVVCENPDWCDTEVEDVLVVKAADQGALSIKVELVQANAHTCTFENTLPRVGDRAWQWKAPEGEEPCVLDLLWTDKLVKLEPEGCRDFCGARASLFAAFSYPPKSE